MKALIYLFLLFSFNTLHALEVDEKLTLRFLKVSSTKKTILVNRGAEDGLVVGNHAKFFTTSGVIARGVVEKVSPSRSIWSLYRVIDPNEITDGKVLNLKIGTPVKITEDSTKSLAEEMVPSGTDKIAVPSAKAKSEEVDSFEADYEEPIEPQKTYTQAAKKEVSVVEPTGTTANEWEVWGNASASMLSGNATNVNIGTVSASTSSSSSTLDFSAGVEKYFFQANSFLNQCSLTGFAHKRTTSVGQDIQIGEDLLEFGAGVRYHFNQSASLTNAIMPFALLDLGLGSVTLENKVVGATTATDPTVKGSNKFFAVGGGAKYILGNGLGFKSILDYYSSSESYTFTSTTGSRSLAGFRLQIGLSYRF